MVQSLQRLSQWLAKHASAFIIAVAVITFLLPLSLCRCCLVRFPVLGTASAAPSWQESIVEWTKNKPIYAERTR